MDYLKTSQTGGKISRRTDKQKGKTPRLKTKVLGHPLEAVNKQGLQVISTAYIPALIKNKIFKVKFSSCNKGSKNTRGPPSYSLSEIPNWGKRKNSKGANFFQNQTKSSFQSFKYKSIRKHAKFYKYQATNEETTRHAVISKKTERSKLSQNKHKNGVEGGRKKNQTWENERKLQRKAERQKAKSRITPSPTKKQSHKTTSLG